MAKRPSKEKKYVHLHWAFRNGPERNNIAKAASACGAYGLLKGEWTPHVGDATCPTCLEKARRAPEPERAPAPEPVAKVLRGDWSFEPGAIITVLKDNPQKPGTPKHFRWDQIWKHAGHKWERYRDDGGNPTTLRNAIKNNYARIG
jgi:hypothetical protein